MAILIITASVFYILARSVARLENEKGIEL